MHLSRQYSSYHIVNQLRTKKTCTIQFCIFSVDCVWMEFNFSECSKTSSNQCGTRKGTRSILRPAQFGGTNCTGPSEITVKCSSDPEGGKSLSGWVQLNPFKVTTLIHNRKRKHQTQVGWPRHFPSARPPKTEAPSFIFSMWPKCVTNKSWADRNTFCLLSLMFMFPL